MSNTVTWSNDPEPKAHRSPVMAEVSVRNHTGAPRRNDRAEIQVRKAMNENRVGDNATPRQRLTIWQQSQWWALSGSAIGLIVCLAIPLEALGTTTTAPSQWLILSFIGTVVGFAAIGFVIGLIVGIVRVAVRKLDSEEGPT